MKTQKWRLARKSCYGKSKCKMFCEIIRWRERTELCVKINAVHYWIKHMQTYIDFSKLLGVPELIRKQIESDYKTSDAGGIFGHFTENCQIEELP